MTGLSSLALRKLRWHCAFTNRYDARSCAFHRQDHRSPPTPLQGPLDSQTRNHPEGRGLHLSSPSPRVEPARPSLASSWVGVRTHSAKGTLERAFAGRSTSVPTSLVGPLVLSEPGETADAIPFRAIRVRRRPGLLYPHHGGHLLSTREGCGHVEL